MTGLEELLRRYPFPEVAGTKDDHGTLAVIGGPPSCPGAPMLAAVAALRTGAGRTQLIVDPTVAAVTATAVPEALVLGWDLRTPAPPEVLEVIRSTTAVVFGPGHADQHPAALAEVVECVEGRPVVLDAGALPNVDQLAVGSCFVIAPNVNEARRLARANSVPSRHDEGEGEGDDDGAVVAGRLAANLASSMGRAVAVRGPSTVVADHEGGSWHHAGVSGLGTPGSGDVAVGVLGGLLARGLPVLGALAWAIGLHARAGAILAVERPVGFLAREIADALPAALVELHAVGEPAGP